MKKDFAISQMGDGGVPALAALLNIRRQAIYQWKDNIPELQAYKLQELRPDLFPPPKRTRRRRRRSSDSKSPVEEVAA